MVTTNLGIKLLKKSSLCCRNGIFKPLLQQPKLFRQKHAAKVYVADFIQ